MGTVALAKKATGPTLNKTSGPPMKSKRRCLSSDSAASSGRNPRIASLLPIVELEVEVDADGEAVADRPFDHASLARKIQNETCEGLPPHRALILYDVFAHAH